MLLLDARGRLVRCMKGCTSRLDYRWKYPPHNRRRPCNSLFINCWTRHKIAFRKVLLFGMTTPPHPGGGLGNSCSCMQVGIPRVRVAGQLVMPIYVGYRLNADPPRVNTGPVEYIPLYTAMWASFTTAGSQVSTLSDMLHFCSVLLFGATFLENTQQ